MNEIQQAIIASPASNSDSKRKLLAGSAGINQQTIDELSHWIPSGNDLVDSKRASICFFRPAPSIHAVVRTTAGSENPDDGSVQFLSKLILFSSEQLERYDNNAGLLLQAIRSAGLLICPLSSFVPKVGKRPTKLKTIDLNEPLFDPLAGISTPAGSVTEFENIVDAIKIHGRVAIFGLAHPFPYLTRFLNLLPYEDRLQVSFCCGQKIRDDRPFAFQFYESADFQWQDHAANQQVRAIDLSKTTPFQVA